MNSGFYSRLAANNIKKNRKVYLPYLLASIFTTMMYYMIYAISKNEGLDQVGGANSLKSILAMGTTVIAIFAVIFLFYTNRFLMKRRQKEIGLLNILGMNKGHIGKMMFCETLQIAGITMVAGLGGGILLNKLVFMALFKILNFSVPLGFTISVKAVLSTLTLYIAISLLILLSNLGQIHLTNPIDLLRGGQTGEREPKTKWLLAVIGAACLGVGYAIAILTESPLDALTLFFLAVILVILGTYFLFTAGSVAILKMLRKNNKFYYQTKHFISVSGMIYRMKQNAVGLANICILSTGVLLMISSTVSLYIGQKDVLLTRFPKEVRITCRDINDQKMAAIDDVVRQTLDGRNLTETEDNQVTYGELISIKDKNNFGVAEPEEYNAKQIKEVYLVPLSEYNRITGENETLEAGEALMHSTEKETLNQVSLGGEKYQVKKQLDHFFMAEGTSSGVVIGAYFFVMPDEDAIRQILKKQDTKGAEVEGLTYMWEFDLKGQESEIRQFEDDLSAAIQEQSLGRVEGRLASKQDFYATYGGLFFIGIFLGMLFLMATVLIIYYKQISEGYDDKERFTIMQKVGMGKREIRGSIRSQVLMVFFLPLVMAIIHIGVAFPMVTRLLAMMSLLNVELFAICTIGVIVIFAVLYAIVYGVTARLYYKIVE